jgi:MoaA/NifB/PqqE/SkfB family radical SAM enzyme
MIQREQTTLTYDHSRWVEIPSIPENTLQIFVTNKCNMRCKGCFMAHRLGKGNIDVDSYRSLVEQYKNTVTKVTLLGGEPTLHPDLSRIVSINNENNLKTTIYTNGHFLDRLVNLPREGVSLRIGVYGNKLSEKPLNNIKNTDFPIKIVYMLRKDNLDELMDVALEAENRFDCKAFYLSSIRDITETGDFWVDTDDTISQYEFANIVQNFVNEYSGNINQLDISTRGVLRTKSQAFDQVKHCRFGNIFQDGQKIICPFDIGRNVTSSELSFGERKCNKNTSCILQKIILRRV